MTKPNFSAGLHTLSQYLMWYAQKKEDEQRRQQKEEAAAALRKQEYDQRVELMREADRLASARSTATYERENPEQVVGMEPSIGSLFPKPIMGRAPLGYAQGVVRQDRMDRLDEEKQRAQIAKWEADARNDAARARQAGTGPQPEYKNADLRQMIIDAAGGFTPPKEHWSDKKGETAYGPDLISDAEAMASVGVLDPAIASAIGSYGPGVDPNVAAEAAYRAAYPPLDLRREQEIVSQLGGNAYPGGMVPQRRPYWFDKSILGQDWAVKDPDPAALSDPKADDVLSALAKASVDGKITDAEMGRIAQKYGWTRDDLDAFLAKKRIMGVTEPRHNGSTYQAPVGRRSSEVTSASDDLLS
jgi:hypothetical protein